MTIGARLTAASDYLFRRLFKVLFRYDIFISYARRDGKEYALKLKEQLTRLDFSCFLDYDELPAGNSLNRTLKRAIRRSATVIVVGTEGALKSRYVELEVAEFAGTGRSIIPIDFEGTLAAAPWPVVKERDLVWVDETKDALAKNVPSPAVADAVDKLFKYTRRNVRVRWQVIATAALFVLGAAASGLVIRQQVAAATVERQAAELARGAARQEQEKAEAAAARARQQEEIATANALKAQQKEQEANEQADEARKQGEIARKQTAEAQKQATLARAKAAEARQQQRLATERQKLATSRELISAAKSQMAYDPELSVLLASEAVRVADTDETGRAEAESMLRQSSSASHVRVVKSVSQWDWQFSRAEPVFSPDGKLVATAEPDGHAVRVWRAESGEEVALLRGHTDGVTSIAFSPNGLRVAAAGKDQTAWVWDLKGVEPPLVLRGHEDPVSGVAFSPDGKWIVTAGDDTRARVWDAKTGRLHKELPIGQGRVVRARFSPDSSLVVTVRGQNRRFRDFGIRVWDAQTGDPLATIEEEASDATFSPDGRYVMAAVSKGMMGTGSKGVTLWAARTGRPAARLAKNLDVSTAEFSPDGLRVVTAGSEGVATIWKLPERITDKQREGEAPPAEGQKEEEVEKIAELRGHRGRVYSAHFSRDGKFVVTAGEDMTARVWHDGAELFELRGHTRGVYSARFNDDGRAVLTAGLDGTARVWDAGGYRYAPPLDGHDGVVRTSAFSPDGRLVVTASGATARVWETRRGWETSTAKPIKELGGQTGEVSEAIFSPDGKTIITLEKGAKAYVWEVGGAWGLKAELTGHEIIIFEAMFTRDGSLLATVGHIAGYRKVVRVWDANTYKPLTQIEPSVGNFIPTAAFSPDGQYIVTSGGDKVEVWEPRTGNRVTELKGTEDLVENARFSPDGRFVVAINLQDVRVWEARTWNPLAVLNNMTRFGEIAFSPDGKLFVAVGEGRGRVWETTANWPERADLRGNVDANSAVTFSPDSKFVVARGAGGTVRVWEASTGESLLVLPEAWQFYGEHGLAVNSEGMLLITAGGDEAAQVYACEECLPLAQLLERACGRVTRALSPIERQYYLHESAKEAASGPTRPCAPLSRRIANAR